MRDDCQGQGSTFQAVEQQVQRLRSRCTLCPLEEREEGQWAEEERVKQRVLPGWQGGWSPDHKEVSKPQGKVWLLFYMGWEATWDGSLQGSDRPWFTPLYAEWIVRDKNKSRERVDTVRDNGEGSENIF